MRKSDYILIGIILLLSLSFYIIFNMIKNSQTDGVIVAKVLYKDEIILEIDLEDLSYNIRDESSVKSISADNKFFTVTGSNGDVVIEVDKGRIRVIDEISPQHICRLQGWSSSPLFPITCLPNNVVIIVEAKVDELDGIVG